MEFELPEAIVIATVIGVENLPCDILGQKKLFSPDGDKRTGNIKLPWKLPMDWLDEELACLSREALKDGKFRTARLANPEEPEQIVKVMIDPYLPCQELIILGGGHIARQLIQVGHLLGYKITVIDDRPDFAMNEYLTVHDRSICCSFSDLEKVVRLGPASSIVIVTRGHLHDMDCLRTVIKYPFAYLGMIGSRRKVALVKQTLAEEGVTQEKIDQVHMPIGLAIGAQTPAEIAVSIAAELISVRRAGGTSSLKDTTPVKQGEVCEMLTAADRETLAAALAAARAKTPAALATIIKSQGSTPRKSGARMLFYRDGRAYGTIGGGCAEAEVRRMALQVMDEDKPYIYKVVMTADIAAMEGMACGGMLEVFIEPVTAFYRAMDGREN